jgi:hypothetical protein
MRHLEAALVERAGAVGEAGTALELLRDQGVCLRGEGM